MSRGDRPRWDRPSIVLVVGVWVVALLGAAVSVTAAFNVVVAPFRALLDPSPSPSPGVGNLILLVISAGLTIAAFRYAARITNEVLR